MRETIAREREAKAARELESCVRVRAIWRGSFCAPRCATSWAEFADEMAELMLDSQGGGGGSVARGGVMLSSASASRVPVGAEGVRGTRRRRRRSGLRTQRGAKVSGA